MSQRYAPTYRFDLHPSILRQRLSWLLLVSAVMACLFNSWPGLIKGVLLTVVAWGFRLDFKLRAVPAFDMINVDSKGRWFARHAESGESVAIAIRGDTVVSTWIVLLHWHDDEQGGWLAIFPDSLAEDQFRQLRVALRSARPN